MSQQPEEQHTEHGNGRVTNPFASEPIVAAPTGASAAALVQREVAEVQAAMVIAQKFPRDPKNAVDRILTACTRPALAEAAVYQYARGGQNVEGPSIRLAEELARQWGNMLCGVTELERKNGVSEALAYAWDLETNFRDEKRFQVRHWRDTRKGGYAITDERDIYELIANMGARRKRACILAVIPGDVQEAAVKQCEVTLKTKEEVTPERIKAMVEAFAQFRVTREMLEKRIQRRLDAATPALMVQLRKIYNSLKDGMSQPEEWFEIAPQEASAEAEQPTSKTESVKQRMQARRETQAPEPETPAAAAETAEPEAEPEAAIPQFDAETAIKDLERARTVKGLDEKWKAISVDFRDTDRAMPIEVEARFNELRESLEQKEAEL